MEKYNRDKWIKIRTKGKIHFILVRGLLGMGLPYAIIAFALSQAFDSRPTQNRLIQWSIGGLFFGIAMGFYYWHRYEKKLNEGSDWVNGTEYTIDNYLRLFLVSFFIAGFLFGIYWGIYTYFNSAIYGSQTALSYGIKAGLFFGFWIGAFSVIDNYFRNKKRRRLE